MSTNGINAAYVRSKLNHPIIDADGHWREFPPVLTEFIRKAGGEKAAIGFQHAAERVNRVAAGLDPIRPRSAAERHDRRDPQGGWWLSPGCTRDRATAVLPRLMYERLDEIGLDFLVLYPTYGLSVPGIADDEERRAVCRAYNTFLAEEYGKYSDRITPVAIIPMHTPDEAVAELEHAIRQCGLKAIMMGSMIRRPIPAYGKSGDTGRYTTWLDPLGLDSEYDYDPVWAKCVELGVSPSFHTGGNGIGLRVSPTNFVYNHIGHFASAGEAVCKAIFLGGVTRRFPKLRFAFLEGGAGWACNLYSDLIGHWKKRNPKALENIRPENLDRDEFIALAKQYGGPGWAEYIERSQGNEGLKLTVGPTNPDQLDDFAACGIEKARDIYDLFAAKFYFGCEPDDPTVAWAVNAKTNPYGARINALFSSDISHFDVPDMRGVLPEAWELIEGGMIAMDDFRDFVFGNAAHFFTSGNPNFFKGTRVEKAVSEYLKGEAMPQSASAAAGR